MKLKTRQINLRTIDWSLRGIGHLLAQTDPDACPSAKEVYGIGTIIQELGRKLELHAGDRAAARPPRSGSRIHVQERG